LSCLDISLMNIPQPEPLPGETETMPYVLVADDAFLLSPGVMKQYGGRHLTLEECIFNYRLSRVRRTAENAFGIIQVSICIQSIVPIFIIYNFTSHVQKNQTNLRGSVGGLSQNCLNFISYGMARHD